MDNIIKPHKSNLEFKSVSFQTDIDSKEFIPNSSDICSNEEYYSQEDMEGKEYIVERHEEIVSVVDVARYILSCLKDKQCSTMKLHKLLYYCQAWSIVWEEKPLFKERIEAWANGPVIRELFLFHRGMYCISYWDLSNGNENLLSDTQKETIKDVLRFYGDKDAQWLIDLTHAEAPWQIARKGLKQFERGSKEITLDSMAEYYSSL